MAFQEPCHKLAWILDACCKDQSLDERRLKELSGFFAAFQGASRHKSHKRPRDWDTEGGSRAKSDADEPSRVLAEAGMVLREPCTLHLIVHQVKLAPEISKGDTCKKDFSTGGGPGTQREAAGAIECAENLLTTSAVAAT